MSSKNWFGLIKGYSLLDQMTSKNLSTIFGGVCECPVNLMLGPVIHTSLPDQMTSRNLSASSVEYMNDL
jgi:hypothetical protein